MMVVKTMASARAPTWMPMSIHFSRVKRPRCSGIWAPYLAASNVTAAYEVSELFDAGARGLERPGDLAGEEHEDPIAVAQQFVQVARSEDAVSYTHLTLPTNR